MHIEILEQQLQDTKIEFLNEKASNAKLMDNRILEQTILECQLVRYKTELRSGLKLVCSEIF